MNGITQIVRSRQSILEYAKRNGVMQAGVRLNKPRSTIFYWLKRYDGTPESLRG